MEPLKYEEEIARNLKIASLEMYHFGGGDDEADVDDDVICEEVDGRICGYRNFSDDG